MILHFTRTNGPVDESIDQLIRIAEGIHRPEYVREMILAALKAGQEDDDRADLKLMNTTLKEMRFTAKVFGPYRNVRKVTVFGEQRGTSQSSLRARGGRRLTAPSHRIAPRGEGAGRRGIPRGPGPGRPARPGDRLPARVTAGPSGGGKRRLRI